MHTKEYFNLWSESSPFAKAKKFLSFQTDQKIHKDLVLKNHSLLFLIIFCVFGRISHLALIHKNSCDEWFVLEKQKRKCWVIRLGVSNSLRYIWCTNDYSSCKRNNYSKEPKMLEEKNSIWLWQMIKLNF